MNTKNDIFIDKANIKHNNKYEYTLVEYVNNYTKVKIICKKHGMFSQTPNHHLKGSGCNECYLESKHDTKDDFIKKSMKVHGELYDYSNVIYKSSKKKVEIICNKHGSFYQRPHEHISGKGCSECGVGGYKRSKPGRLYVYEVLQDDKTIAYKYGITNGTINNRKYYHEYHSNLKFNCVYELYDEDGNVPYNIEKAIKAGMKSVFLSKTILEVGYTETIEPSLYEDLINIIKKGS
ncbi:TPA: hypothetical protein KE178_005116 [Escherichia coli]|nr:hypothetical protein [Escherichia coli]HBC8454906.1 hypothetical protein [Escherichia coli]